MWQASNIVQKVKFQSQQTLYCGNNIYLERHLSKLSFIFTTVGDLNGKLQRRANLFVYEGCKMLFPDTPSARKSAANVLHERLNREARETGCTSSLTITSDKKVLKLSQSSRLPLRFVTTHEFYWLPGGGGPMTLSRCRIKKCGLRAAQGQRVIQHFFNIIRVVQSADRSIVTPHVAGHVTSMWVLTHASLRSNADCMF